MALAPVNVALRLDTSAVHALMASPDSRAALERGFAQGAVGPRDVLFELRQVDSDGLATGANEARLFLQPTDRLRRLLAAGGAGDVD